MADPLTEQERRRHLFYARVFDRLASTKRRRSVLDDLGEAIDRHKTVLDRGDEDTEHVDEQRDGTLN